MSLGQTKRDRVKDCCLMAFCFPVLIILLPSIKRHNRRKDEARASRRRPEPSPPPPEPPLRPLPLARSRRLTDAEGSHTQLQSALIAQIPVEIRLVIWEYLLGRETDQDVLHLNVIDGTLGHVRCYESKPCHALGHDHRCWELFSNRSWRVYPECRDAKRKLQSILLTCKLM